MISISTMLKLCLIVYGILFFCRSILSLAKRRLTESFCVFWTVLSLIMIISGILLNPISLNAMISIEGFILIVTTAFSVIEAAYYLSKWISQLERKNRELTMQVALLISDVEALREDLRQ